MENWRPVPGFEGWYEVSDIGRVRCLPHDVRVGYGATRTVKGRMLKPQKLRNGYLQVSLGRGRKHADVHRLVALAFLPPVEGKDEVNHKNLVKTDNRVENLEWVSHHENLLHAHREGAFDYNIWRKKLRCAQTGQIFESSYAAAEWVNETQKQFSGNVSHISSNIRTAVRLNRHAYGFKWEHAEEQPSTTIPKGSTPKRAEMGSPS